MTLRIFLSPSGIVCRGSLHLSGLSACTHAPQTDAILASVERGKSWAENAHRDSKLNVRYVEKERREMRPEARLLKFTGYEPPKTWNLIPEP
jgi:hypothetical protein